MRALANAIAVLLITGCGGEEEPVANKFERARAEIENKARTLETQVENEVSAFENRLDSEASAFLNQQEANDVNAAEPTNQIP